MMSPTRIDTAHIGHDDFVTTIPADPAADGLQYSAELVARVQAEADHAAPWWFWEAAVAAFILAIAASAVWPMGVAP